MSKPPPFPQHSCLQISLLSMPAQSGPGCKRQGFLPSLPPPLSSHSDVHRTCAVVFPLLLLNPSFHSLIDEIKSTKGNPRFPGDGYICFLHGRQSGEAPKLLETYSFHCLFQLRCFSLVYCKNAREMIVLRDMRLLRDYGLLKTMRSNRVRRARWRNWHI